MNYLFVGEKRSERAKKQGVFFGDGKSLAGCKLFEALKYCGINQEESSFCNLFERGGITKVRRHKGTIIALGNKVYKELRRRGYKKAILIYHPAVRYHLGSKQFYNTHVKERLVNL